MHGSIALGHDVHETASGLLASSQKGCHKDLSGPRAVGSSPSLRRLGAFSDWGTWIQSNCLYLHCTGTLEPTLMRFMAHTEYLWTSLNQRPMYLKVHSATILLIPSGKFPSLVRAKLCSRGGPRATNLNFDGPKCKKASQRHISGKLHSHMVQETVYIYRTYYIYVYIFVYVYHIIYAQNQYVPFAQPATRATRQLFDFMKLWVEAG